MYLKTLTLLLLFFKISVTSFGGIYSVWALTEEIFVIGDKETSGNLSNPDEVSNPVVVSISGKIPGSETALNPGKIGPVLNSDEFKKIFSISQLIPGPKTSSLSLIGLKFGGFLPMIAIYLGLVLPGLILIPLLNHANSYLKKFTYFDGFRQGVKLAVIGILILFSIGLLRKGTGYEIDRSIIFILIASMTFFINRKYGLNPIILIDLSAVLGYFFF